MFAPTIKTQPTPVDSSTPDQTCYFSLAIRTGSHFSDETPCTSPTSTTSTASPISDPQNPLLAFRPSSIEMTSPTGGNLLQLQTSAAHPQRPQPVPLQDMLVTSDDSSASESSDSTPPTQIARCSRCHRTTSIDSARPHKSGMLQYGLNQWYCTRCATIVGYRR